MKRVASHNMYLIFDRYFNFSNISGPRAAQADDKVSQHTNYIYIPHRHPRNLSLQ